MRLVVALLLVSGVASLDVEFPKSLKTQKAALRAWSHKCNLLYTFKYGGTAEILTSTLKEHKNEDAKAKDEGKAKDKGKVKIAPEHDKNKGKEKPDTSKPHKREPKKGKDDKKQKDDAKNHTYIATVQCSGKSGDITSWVIDFLRDDGWKKVGAK